MNKIYHIDKIGDRETYVKYIKNKKFTKIDKYLNKLLNKIFLETILLVENNKLNKEVERFNNLKEKIIDYSEEIKYKPGLKYKTLEILPFLDKTADKVYLEGLRKNFNLSEIKDELIELFAAVEMTIIKLKENSQDYKSYLEKLNNLILDIDKYTEIINEEKEKELGEKDKKYFENLYININQIKGDFTELKIILEIYSKQLEKLTDILLNGNNKFKQIFKEIIGVRSLLLGRTIKNKASIIKEKQLNQKLGKIKIYFNKKENKIEKDYKKAQEIYNKIKKSY